MNLGKLIKQARIEAGLTQAQLATDCGWSDSNNRISNYELGKREPELRDLSKIAKATKREIEFFVSAYKEPAIYHETQHTKRGNHQTLGQQQAEYFTQARNVPLVDWRQAGQWHDISDRVMSDKNTKWIQTTALVGPRAFAVVVVGDSMFNSHGIPTFPPGFTVTVDPNTEAENQSIVVIKQGSEEEPTMKMLVFDGGRRYLKPLNSYYPISELQENFLVIGVVKKVELEL